VVGGTGFYIQALLYDIDFTESDSDASYRSELECYANEHGVNALHEKLRAIDPESADSIHANNVKRVIRALEYYHLTGEKISVHNAREREKESPYDYRYFVLNDKRDHLYRRIDLRVDQMMEEGLLQEVKRLKEMGYHRGMVSMQGLGYKEILSYLDGEISLDEAVYEIKRDTRHFAKRQITWFKRERNVIWVNKDEYGYDEKKILNSMMMELADDPAFGKIRG
ncbi:MAG: tRNA (adenosine(37)-N6)-dimethylallyltransferase MiaA, partial [Coprococcus sp.]